jgi:hypothetical protein
VGHNRKHRRALRVASWGNLPECSNEGAIRVEVGIGRGKVKGRRERRSAPRGGPPRTFRRAPPLVRVCRATRGSIEHVAGHHRGQRTRRGGDDRQAAEGEFPRAFGDALAHHRVDVPRQDVEQREDQIEERPRARKTATTGHAWAIGRQPARALADTSARASRTNVLTALGTRSSKTRDRLEECTEMSPTAAKPGRRATRGANGGLQKGIESR